MKESELKPLVKQILREMFKKQLNEWSSDTMDDYDIEFEHLVIPGLSTETDSVIVTVSLSYEANPGSSARGLSGPPEHSEPGEDAEVHLLDWDFSHVTINPQEGQPKKIDDFKSINKEQFELLKKSVNDYISANKDVIEGQILEKIGDVDDSDGFRPGQDY